MGDNALKTGYHILSIRRAGYTQSIFNTYACLDVQGHVSLAPSAHLGDSPLKVGARIPVMVLFVDYQVPNVLLSLSHYYLSFLSSLSRFPHFTSFFNKIIYMEFFI